jgi:hypothetical protein
MMRFPCGERLAAGEPLSPEQEVGGSESTRAHQFSPLVNLPNQNYRSRYDISPLCRSGEVPVDHPAPWAEFGPLCRPD